MTSQWFQWWTDLLHQASLSRLLLALLLGACVGAERQWRQRAAGLRTNTLVCFGAAAFVDLGLRVAPGTTQVIAYVVSGVGFHRRRRDHERRRQRARIEYSRRTRDVALDNHGTGEIVLLLCVNTAIPGSNTDWGTSWMPMAIPCRIGSSHAVTALTCRLSYPQPAPNTTIRRHVGQTLVFRKYAESDG